MRFSKKILVICVFIIITAAPVLLVTVYELMFQVSSLLIPKSIKNLSIKKPQSTSINIIKANQSKQESHNKIKCTANIFFLTRY